MNDTMLRFDTKTAAQYAGEKLDSLLERASRDTAQVIEQQDIPTAVAFFAELRDIARNLSEKLSAVQKVVDGLSYEALPTMFTNANVKTIRVENVGRVSINVRWSASMPDKETGLGWLKQTGNAGLIQETVNAQSLGAFAKEETMHGRPLPSDIFKVTSTPYVSITKA